MQRRAAAAYAGLFILIAVGAYVMVGVAQEPAVTVENPDHSLGNGDELTVDGRTYTVGEITDGAAPADRSADLTWTNQSALYTEELANGSTIAHNGTNVTVTTHRNDSPPAVTFTEVRTVPENASTVEQNGTTFVIVRRDDESVLVPRAEYLMDRYGEPRTDRFEVGDSFAYDNQTVTLASVSAGVATIEWTAPRENTVAADNGGNVTLGPNERLFVAHFPDNGTLELSSDVAGYREQLDVRNSYHTRINGLWGISILSGLAAVFLIGAAYLPSRY